MIVDFRPPSSLSSTVAENRYGGSTWDAKQSQKNAANGSSKLLAGERQRVLSAKRQEQLIRKQHFFEERHAEYRREKEIEERRLREKVANLSKQKDEKLAVLLNTLVDQKPFVAKIDQFIEQNNAEWERKKAQQYNEWSSKVYDLIQNQIQSKMSKLTTEEVEKRHNELFGSFLKATNAKDGLFRDIIIESDYDPFKNKNLITYDVSKIRDPLKKPLIKQMEEEEFRRSLFIEGGENKNSKKGRRLGREVLDLKFWDKVESTPYGRFSHEIPISNKKSLKPASNIVFDHFNIDRSPVTAAKEFYSNRRTFVYLFALF